LPMRVLALRVLAGATAARGLLFPGILASFFLGLVFLAHLRGFGAFEAGLAFLPMTFVLGVLSSGITARLMARFGPLNVLVAGMATIIVALSLFAIADGHTSYFPGLLAGYALLGLGGGMSFLPLLTISMSEVPM